MNLLDKKLEEYTSFLCDSEDIILRELTRETNLKVLMAHMLSGHVQGKFLEFISKIQSPRRILEIGTFTAYSTICLSKGLQEDGIITTIESNEELKHIIIKYLAKAEIQNKTNLIIGDAIDILSKLTEVYDLVFIDADKRQYLDYYKLIIDKVRSGGIILADNIFWHGKILEPIKSADLHTQKIVEFNEYVRLDSRVEKFVFPYRDGVYIIRKK